MISQKKEKKSANSWCEKSANWEKVRQCVTLLTAFVVTTAIN
jgi:hypothetical protein